IERLTYRLGCVYWLWPASGGGAPLLDYPVVVRAAWDALRELANELRCPYPPEPAAANTPQACRNAIDLVAGWCLERAGDVQPAPCLPSPGTPARDEGPPRSGAPLSPEEANAAVRLHLQGNPGATIREVNQATGVSTGRISKLPAWQAHQAMKTAARPSLLTE